MFRRQLLTVIGACLCVVGCLYGPAVVRYPSAILLVAFLPGAAATRAIFGKSRDGAEWILVSIGFSLVITILDGLALIAKAVIDSKTLAYSLAGITIVISILDVVVRMALGSRADGGGASRASRSRLRISIPQILMLACAAVLVAAAFAYARKPMGAHGATGYTVLWIDPPGSLHPKLGMESQELHLTSYRLQFIDGSHVIRRWQIVLAPGQRWHAPVPSTAPGKGTVQAVLQVRRDGSWVPYRRVRLVR